MMVQMMMKLTLSKFSPSLRKRRPLPPRLFLFPQSLLLMRKGWGWGGGVRGGRGLPVFATVSSTHLCAAHPTITPHMPPVFVCLQLVCFLCRHYWHVWSLIATNSNPNPKKLTWRLLIQKVFGLFFSCFYILPPWIQGRGTDLTLNECIVKVWQVISFKATLCNYLAPEKQLYLGGTLTCHMLNSVSVSVILRLEH